MNTGLELAERGAVLDQIRTLVDGATEEVTLSVPDSAIEPIAATLADAVDRGLLVLVLVWDSPGDDRPSQQAGSLVDRSTVARRSPDIAPVFCCVDNERGLVGDASALDDDSTDHSVGIFDFQDIASGLYRDFVTNFWMVSSEIYAADAPELPATYDGIRHAVTDAALCLRSDVPVACRATGSDTMTDADRTVDGRVLNVHQRMVYPASSSLPIENSILVEDGERQWVGGPHAMLEDVAAQHLTLRRL